MSRHHSSKSCSGIEIIPVADLKIIPWQEKERFLIMKRDRRKVLLTGLREYLGDLRGRSPQESHILAVDIRQKEQKVK